MKRVALIVTVAFALGVALVAPRVMAQKDDSSNNGFPKVITPDSLYSGKSYSEWSAQWWQWTYSIPVANHPLFDNGDCSVGQSGPVWFLGGKLCQANGTACNGSVTRTCNIPHDTALFVPVAVTVEDSALEELNNNGCGNIPPLITSTITQLYQCAASLDDYLSAGGKVVVIVDGFVLPQRKNYFRVQSPVFELTLPADNALNATGEGPFSAGTYSPAVADGTFLFLAPLSPGRHTLQFVDTFPNFTSSSDTYYLTVAK
jgi:hypothetical protein